MLRPSRGRRRILAAGAVGLLSCGVGFSSVVASDGSQGLPGIPSRAVTAMKPSRAPGARGRGAIHFLDRTYRWVMPLPGPHEVFVGLTLLLVLTR